MSMRRTGGQAAAILAVSAMCFFAAASCNSGNCEEGSADPACGTPIGGIAACKDGIDNDGDGLIDFPNDPGCIVSLDDIEDDPCPEEGCPTCANQRDDDGDGLIDYPEDPGCSTAADQDETNLDSGICGSQVSVQPLPEDDLVNGFLNYTQPSELSSECGGGGPEAVFSIDVDEPMTIAATTDFEETSFDTILYLRTECREQGTDLGCDDDGGQNKTSNLLVNIEPGRHYLVVDSRDIGGSYKVVVQRFLFEGLACGAGVDLECLAGLVCRKATPGASGTTCERPQCSDGRDYDGDGKNDYPEDPGCEDPDDNDEADTCPAGPGCPACGNGVDDDGAEDTVADWPDDLGCTSASDTSEDNCADSDPVVTITSPVTMGTTSDAVNDFKPSCYSFSTARDIAHRLVIPGRLVSLQIDTEGSKALEGGHTNSVIYIKQDVCSAADLACDNEGGEAAGDALMTLSDVAPGSYYILVDGTSSASGNFVLNVSGVIQAGQACNPAQVAAGLFTCENAGACTDNVCQ
jgi:hypothetical protein